MHLSKSKKYGLTVEKVGDQTLLNGRFSNFDELSATAAGWDLDFVQLDPGPAPSELTQILTPGLAIQRFRFGRTYLQRGASSPTMRTFGFAEPGTDELRMFGRAFTASDLVLFRAGDEFESVTPPDFCCVAISVEPDQLEAAFAAIEMPHRERPAELESGLMKVDARIMNRLRRRATQALAALNADPLGRLGLVEELTYELSIDLALAIHSADDSPRRGASRGRDRAFKRAVSLIDDHLDESITIRGLCEELDVGWTTLVHAFREQLGVTPKAYLRTIRLHRARGNLLEAAPESGIADVANLCGFWHMGQFAADYKRLFGELPSDTRSRGPAREPADPAPLARAERSLDRP